MKKQVIVLFLLPALIFFSPQVIESQELQNFVIEGRFFYGDSARGPITGVCADRDYLYITENLDSLRIFDISATAFPIHQTGACYADNADHLIKEGDLVVGAGVVDWDGFDIFDVSNVYAPSRLSGGGGNDVIAHPKIAGSYLYTPFWHDATGAYGLKSYDIADPGNPILADYITPFWFNGFDIEFYGAIAYMTDWGNRNETKIFDISNPHDIIEIGSIPYGAGSLKIYGRHLFCGPPVDYNSEPVRIYDVQDPLAPVLELELPVSLPYSWSMDIANGYLFLFQEWDELLVLDVGGFSYPESLGAFFMPSPMGPPNWCFSQVAVKNDIVYYAAGDSGLYVLRYTGPMPINTGDANASGEFNGIDVTYMVNWFRASGPPILEPPERGDANGDCVVNGVDVVYMVNYLKGFGPEPIRAFCYGH